MAAPAYPGEGYIAVAQADRGEVVALGQSLWWFWLSQDRAKRRTMRRCSRNLLEKTGDPK